MQPSPNLKVKAALTLRGVPLYASFAEIGISQVKGSKILSGITIPSDSEKEAIAKLLDKKTSELFPSSNQSAEVA